jgi:hypothetical protein
MRTGDFEVDQALEVLRAQAMALQTRADELNDTERDYVERATGEYLDRLTEKYAVMSDEYRYMPISDGSGTTRDAFLKAIGLLSMMLRNAEVRVNGMSAASIRIEVNNLEAEYRINAPIDAPPLEFAPPSPEPKVPWYFGLLGVGLAVVLILLLVLFVSLLVVAGRQPAAESNSSLSGWMVMAIVLVLAVVGWRAR